jgi:hypothetical protein
MSMDFMWAMMHLSHHGVGMGRCGVTAELRESVNPDPGQASDGRTRQNGNLGKLPTYFRMMTAAIHGCYVSEQLGQLMLATIFME